MEINKEEFCRKFNYGDVFGLDNLGKQLDKLFNSICEKEKEIMRKWNSTENLELKNELNKDIKMYEKEQEDICRAKAVLELTRSANSILIETETCKYANDFYENAGTLYHSLLNNLLDLVGIAQEDFEKYAV
jgi:hypothetical protein